MSEKRTSIVWALLAAALYAISSPVSKLLLQEVEPTMMAALLYLGAGLGMLLLGIVRRRLGLGASEQRLTRRDLPYTVGMIVLDVAAPICLMIGLTSTTSANASLLNNFEIVATSLIALLVFREAISRRLWLAIGLITLSSLILSLEDASSLSFSSGSLLVLAACVCWGFENNCTRMMSQSDPLEIVVLKGFGSGLGSLAIALAVGESLPAPPLRARSAPAGISRLWPQHLFLRLCPATAGAAKTSAHYAIVPFIGVGLSLVLFHTWPEPSFWVALAIMAAGAHLAAE